MKLYTAEQIRQALATAHGSHRDESDLDELLAKLDTELSKATTQPYFTTQQIDTAINTAFDKADEQGNINELVSYIDIELDSITKGIDNSTPKQRVEIELAQLTERLQKLEAFIGNYQPNQLDESLPIWRMSVDNRKWLLYQRQCMIDYKRALEARLKIWKEI